MKQITISGIPSEVEKEIEIEKERRGISINKAIISLLEKAVGINRKSVSKRTFHHDLDHLAGSWSKVEAKEFEIILKDQRKIDEDIWS